MLKIPRKFRIWIFLFALWLSFEPMVLTVLQAQDIPQKESDKFSDMEGFMAAAREAKKPGEVMQKVLYTQGVIADDMDQNKIKGQLEGRAYVDFLMTVTSAYDLMDSGAADSISVFDALKGLSGIEVPRNQVKSTNRFVTTPTTGVDLLAKLGDFTNRCSKKLFMFFGGKYRTSLSDGSGKWKQNVLKAFMSTSNRTRKIVPKVAEFLKNMEPMEDISETKAYFKCIRGQEGGISKTAAVARSIGIGLTILSIALSTYSIATNDDTHGTKQFSYANVKDGVGILLGLAALAAMFCTPPVGWVVALITFIVAVVAFIGDKLGEYNAKWKQAYRRSFDFLKKEDPEFRLFYQYREKVVPERRSAAWLVADQKIKDWREGATGDGLKRVNEIYDQLERQGVLSTYYNRAKFKLPKMDLNQLQDLWKKKADYMAWKPTDKEIEDEKNRSTLSKVFDYVSIWNYPVWGVNKIREGFADREMKKQLESYPPVFFNPDFILQRRYQNFLTAKKERQGSLYSVVGLRLEQAPFNYIWMVGVDTSSWDQDLCLAALEGDVFFCGVKEMQYLGKTMEAVVDQLEKQIENSDKQLSKTKKTCEQIENQLKWFSKLIEVYREEKALSESEENTSGDDSNSEETSESAGINWLTDAISNTHRKKYWEVWKPCHGAFGWQESAFRGEGKKMNAKSIIMRYRADIEQFLTGIPLGVNVSIGEMAQLQLMVKSVNDRHVLYKKLGEERKESVEKLSSDLKEYPALLKYLEDNSFLGVSGNGIMDWLSGISPAKKDMEHYTDLYMDQVEEYGELAATASSNKRSSWLFFTKDFPNPRQLTERMSKILQTSKEVMDKYEEISNELDEGFDFIITDDEWYSAKKLPLDLDKEKPLDIDEILADVQPDALTE